MEHSQRFLNLINEKRHHIRELPPEEVQSRITNKDALLIDTREDHEWERGHIPGATHLSKGLIERDIEKLAPDLDKEIILYCGGGYRSVLAADSLKQMGYTNVRSMIGGWKAWLVRGLPIEGGEHN